MTEFRVAIDAGHGLNTPGKRCDKKYDINQTREYALNRKIADLLATAIDNQNIEKSGCRPIQYIKTYSDKEDVSLKKRCKLANDFNADLFISIHHNAGGGHGTEAFYYDNGKDDLRHIQAVMLYKLVVEETQLVGSRYLPVKTGNNFYVIKHNKCPAFILENGFMDNEIDVPIILTDEHAANTARGLLHFINWYSLPESTAVIYTVKEGDTLWSIAQKYYGSGYLYERIMQENGLASETILPGQTLTITPKMV